MNGWRSAVRDRRLECEVGELFGLNPRLRELDVSVRFDGGVAHVQGVVPSHGDRALVREQIVRLRDVQAVWDRIRVEGQGALRIVDVGCGRAKQYPESVGMDRTPGGAVDVVADLVNGLPLATGSVDRLFAVHVLEHLLDVLSVMNELHRVLAPHGVLHAMTPDRAHVNAVADPTHVRFFDVQTYKHFCTDQPNTRPWWPHLVSTDGASILADLSSIPAGSPLAPAEHLARFFD